MSAVEVIEQIKALPPHEQERVVEFVEKTKAAAGANNSRETTAEFRAMVDQIFDRYDPLFRKLAE